MRNEDTLLQVSQARGTFSRHLRWRLFVLLERVGGGGSAIPLSILLTFSSDLLSDFPLPCWEDHVLLAFLLFGTTADETSFSYSTCLSPLIFSSQTSYYLDLTSLEERTLM
jgi:hypothetical protein